LSRLDLAAGRVQPRRRRALAALAALALGTGGASLPSGAQAISNDYCGQYLLAGQRCYEGSGYRPWRYHKSSTNNVVWLPYMCAHSWTGSNYRTGSGCIAYAASYSFCNASAYPEGNSSVSWDGNLGSNTYRIYGRADDSLNHTNIDSNNGC
jgi:hypothetical protein